MSQMGASAVGSGEWNEELEMRTFDIFHIILTIDPLVF
jgi:hypothetical protein